MNGLNEIEDGRELRELDCQRIEIATGAPVDYVHWYGRSPKAERNGWIVVLRDGEESRGWRAKDGREANERRRRLRDHVALSHGGRVVRVCANCVVMRNGMVIMDHGIASC